MKALSLYLVIFLSVHLPLCHNEAQDTGCCQTKVVTGLGALDGVYELQGSGQNPGPVCTDGCIYTKVTQDGPNMEEEDIYCFKTENTSHPHSVTCSNTTTPG